MVAGNSWSARVPADGVEHRRVVGQAVGVDSAGDLPAVVRHARHWTPLLDRRIMAESPLGWESTSGACPPGDARKWCSMATFVLVPGADGAAWYWHRVVPALRGGGHEVVTLDLPG